MTYQVISSATTSQKLSFNAYELNYCIFFVFSVGQMAVSPSSHFYFLRLLILALQVHLMEIKHLLIV